MTVATDPIYLGWTTLDGRHAVAVVRGSVFTPVRPLRARAGADLRWGGPGPGAEALAEALVVDVLGPEGRCPGCAGRCCAECGRTGLSSRARDAVDRCVHGVAGLPEPDFDLPGRAVLDWIDGRRGGP